LRTVITPAYRGETEIANEPLCEPSVDKRGKGLVFRRDFGAVEKRETAKFEFRVGGQREGKIGLAHETVGVVLSGAVRGKIGAAEPELTGSTRKDGMGWKINDGVLCAFDEPFEALGFLADPDAQKRVFERVSILRGRRGFEPVPGLGAEAPVDSDVERT